MIYYTDSDYHYDNSPLDVMLQCDEYNENWDDEMRQLDWQMEEDYILWVQMEEAADYNDLKDEYTIKVNADVLDTLYYACAQAEMMWRHRSHNPEIDNVGRGEDPEEFEAHCRAEMKRARVAQTMLAEQMPNEWYDCTGPWS